MFNRGKPPGSNSNTAYIGSYQHTLAVEAGHSIELRRLIAEANAQADVAYSQGHNDGYAAGWEAAAEQANANMRLQLAYTRQHIADKERLQKMVDEQARQLKEAESLLNTSHEGHRFYRQTIEKLRQEIATLKQNSRK